MIELSNLSKSFMTASGRVDALKNVSLTVNDGDIYGIIGMSGAGKSTLVRCINMLERPTEGKVIIDGQDLGTLGKKEMQQVRRKVSMIFQSFNLLMQRSCIENIMFPLQLIHMPRKEAEQKARELLEIVGLPEKAKAFPAQLSGGQQQRIAIARALATDPRVLLCDEATSALDPKTTHSILALIKEINARTGITVIIITHQMSVVEQVCNRVAILENGSVVEEGEVARVFSHPKAAATKALVYPETVVREMAYTGDRGQILRLTFDGVKTANSPVVTTMAIDCGIAANILNAAMRTVGERVFGSMIIQIPGGPEELARAVNYLSGHKHITVQVDARYSGEEAAE